MSTATAKTRASWLGVRGETWTYRATSAPLGRRVVVIRWLEDNPNLGRQAGDLDMRDVDGDGRTGELVTHDSLVIANGTDSDADRYADNRLGSDNA